MLAMVRTPWATQWSRNAWPVNVFEDADAYRVQAILPGVTPEELEITAHPENYLTIAGEVKVPTPENARALWSEFGTAKFRRAVSLPLPFDAERAEVSYRNGVVEIVLPKREEAKPRQIKVLTASAS
jgi:HSP20 family protein